MWGIYKIRGCLKAFITRVLKNFVILYSGSCVLASVFLLLHLVSSRKVCYFFLSLSWKMCVCFLFLFKCWFFWGKAKQKKENKKDWEGNLILLSEKGKKQVSSDSFLTCQIFTNALFDWYFSCLNVCLGVVPDCEVLQVCSPCDHRWWFRHLPGVVLAQDVCYRGALAVPVSFPVFAFIPKFLCCSQNINSLVQFSVLHA